jgi:HPt (histidine-containing phosphotransfer) domain-containing protein
MNESSRIAMSARPRVAGADKAGACAASKPGDLPPTKAKGVFNQARVDELRSVLGEARFERLLGLLMAECRERPLRLREGLCRGDLACVRAEAHRLFGAATSIGACALGDAAMQLETARALVSAVPLVEELENAARDTLGAAQVMLSRFDGKRAHA